MASPLYDIEVRGIDGRVQRLADYAGQVLLVVNTASRCGFTPQYRGLEALYEAFRERGFAVLGFPCNQFGAQEPGSEREIASFCDLHYKVRFPLFAKIDVNGRQAHPLYRYLKHEARGLLGSERIKWNFTKFLVDRQGRVVARYGPMTKPEDLHEAVLKLL